MGVRFMLKRKIKYICEIIFAFSLIFIGYFLWDRIDVEAYEQYITKYNNHYSCKKNNSNHVDNQGINSRLFRENLQYRINLPFRYEIY